MNDPSLNNRASKQVFNGKLLKAESTGVIELSFKYEIVFNRKFDVVASTIPLEYVKPTETIRTAEIDLNFAVGDVVKLESGKSLTVKNIEEHQNINRARMGLPSLDGLTITLEGGK